MTISAERIASSPTPATPAPMLLAAGTVAAWFAIAVAIGLDGGFESAPARPPLAMLTAIAVPPALFVLACATSPAVRRFALSIDLRMLTAIQAWRVLGGAFPFLYAFDILPGAFAWPAGAGDAAVGVFALVALGAMLRGSAGWRQQVYWLNILGLLDFVGAVGTGVLSSNSALGLLYDAVPRASMGAMPLSLIPSFAVPLWIIFHMISLLQLRRLRG